MVIYARVEIRGSRVGDLQQFVSDTKARARPYAPFQTEAGPFANYVPYTHQTGRILNSLAELEPKTLATMHGSTYHGDGAQALRDLAGVMREVLGPKEQQYKAGSTAS